MSTRDVFSGQELARLRGFPEISREELIRFFTLSAADETFVRSMRRPSTVLGVAVQLAGRVRQVLGGCPAAVRGPAVRPQQLRGGDRVGVADAGEPGLTAAARAAIAEVEASCADTGHPQTRFDVGALAAAELLRRVGHGDISEIGALLAQAVPPVSASVVLAAGPDLTGRVVTYRWPAGGPPDELLAPSGQRVDPGAVTGRPSTCQRCGKPLHTDRSRGGRPAKYCSGACRTAAHRARHRTAPDTPG